MKRRTIHVSDADAVKDFASLLDHVRAGAEVIIESDAHPVAILHSVEPERRTLSTCIALAEAHEQHSGTAPVLAPEFAEDVQEIVRNRQPWAPVNWE